MASESQEKEKEKKKEKRSRLRRAPKDLRIFKTTILMGTAADAAVTTTYNHLQSMRWPCRPTSQVSQSTPSATPAPQYSSDQGYPRDTIRAVRIPQDEGMRWARTT